MLARARQSGREGERMTLSTAVVRHYLKNFEFEKLFIEELGWDYHTGTIDVQVDGQTYTMRGLAEKRGVQIFACQSDGSGNLPDYRMRQKIDKQVTKSAYGFCVAAKNHSCGHRTERRDVQRRRALCLRVKPQSGQPVCHRRAKTRRNQADSPG